MLYIFSIIIILLSFIYYSSNNTDWVYYSKNPVKKFLGKLFYRDWVTIWTGVINIILSITLIILVICCVCETSCKETYKQEYLAEYEILQYQIDNDISENYIKDNLTRTTYKDAIDYNQMVLRGRAYHDTFWFGCFYSNIYDDLPLIEIPGGTE